MSRYRSVFGEDPNDPDIDLELFAGDFYDGSRPVSYTYEQQNDPQTIVRPDDFPEPTTRRTRHCRCGEKIGPKDYECPDCKAAAL